MLDNFNGGPEKPSHGKLVKLARFSPLKTLEKVVEGGRSSTIRHVGNIYNAASDILRNDLPLRELFHSKRTLQEKYKALHEPTFLLTTDDGNTYQVSAVYAFAYLNAGRILADIAKDEETADIPLFARELNRLLEDPNSQFEARNPSEQPEINKLKSELAGRTRTHLFETEHNATLRTAARYNKSPRRFDIVGIKEDFTDIAEPALKGAIAGAAAGLMFPGLIILSSPVGAIIEVRREQDRHKRNEWVLVINEDGEGFTKYKEVELSESPMGICQSIDYLYSRIYSTFAGSRYLLPRGTSEEDKRLAQKRAQAMITSLIATSKDYYNLVDRLQTYEILIQGYEYLNPSEVIEKY